RARLDAPRSLFTPAAPHGRRRLRRRRLYRGDGVGVREPARQSVRADVAAARTVPRNTPATRVRHKPGARSPKRPPTSPAGVARLSSLEQTAEHVLQNAAVAVVLEFVERIDAADDRLLPRPAGGVMDAQQQFLPRPQPVGDADNIEHLVAFE